MNGQAPATSPRTNEIETHSWSASIYNPVQIHLQYLPDVVPLARGVESHRPFGRRRAVSWLYRALARTSAHRPRITGSRPRSKSRSCTTKLPTSERILHTSRRTTLAKTTSSSWSRTCASGICRSQKPTARQPMIAIAGERDRYHMVY
jgi:hypothetical protein